MFLIRKEKKENKTCHIQYISLDDFWPKEQKLQWLAENYLHKIPFERITPDTKNNWINLADTDFESLISIVKVDEGQNYLFNFSSLGVSTNRDNWVFDFSKKDLSSKIKFFIKSYSAQLKSKKVNENDLDYSIKWSDALKNTLKNKHKIDYDESYLIDFSYRPFTKAVYYSEKKLSDRLTSNHYEMFGNDLVNNNLVIAFSGKESSKPFSALASNKVFSLDFLEKTNCIPLYRYTEKGERVDNVSKWGLEQFTTHYKDKKITKEDIFHYVYAVLHHPAYRKKYELNLKRDFPRIPFYTDFYKWVAWGKALMDLHINYETVKPFGLKKRSIADKDEPKAKLKADKETNEIILDENTVLSGIPALAWQYKLGNRSALEWVLDQYKDSKPTDPTIAEKFNTYRFADYKTQVIDLLNRVCTVSVETMQIINQMPAE